MPGLDELSRQATRLLTNPPVNRQDFQSAIDDLNKAITAYKSEGHPKREFLKTSSSDMQFININGIESQIRQWETNIKDMKDAPPLPSASSTQRAPAEVLAQGPSTPRITPDITAFDQARINAALERTDPIQYWTNLKAAADVYIAEKIKGGVTASDPEEQIDQRRLEKVSGEQDNISRGTIDHIYELLGSGDGDYTLGEMDKVSKYAQWAIDKQNQADATRQREAEAYQEQRTNPSGRLQFAPAPIDISDPKSVLKALFDRKANPEIWDEGYKTVGLMEKSSRLLQAIENRAVSYGESIRAIEAGLAKGEEIEPGVRESIQKTATDGWAKFSELGRGMQGIQDLGKTANSTYDPTDPIRLGFNDPLPFTGRPMYEMAVKMLGDPPPKIPIIPPEYKDNLDGLAAGVIAGTIKLEFYGPEELRIQARALLQTSADMGYLPALGRLGVVLSKSENEEERGLAKDYLSMLKKALPENFSAAAGHDNRDIGHFTQEYKKLSEAVDPQNSIQPADEKNLGLTSISEVQQRLGIQQHF